MQAKDVLKCDCYLETRSRTKCPHPAKYKYQVVVGSADYLCGLHARRFRGSPSLTPLPVPDNKENLDAKMS